MGLQGKNLMKMKMKMKVKCFFFICISFGVLDMKFWISCRTVCDVYEKLLFPQTGAAQPVPQELIVLVTLST